MRIILLFSLTIGLGLTCAATPANAWYDRWGRWHPNYYRRYYYSYAPPPWYRPPPPPWYYRPRYYAPPPAYYPYPIY